MGHHDVFHSSLLRHTRRTMTHGPNFTWPRPTLSKVDRIRGRGHHQSQVSWRQFQLQYLHQVEGLAVIGQLWKLGRRTQNELYRVITDAILWNHLKARPAKNKNLACTLQSFTTSPSPLRKSSILAAHNTMSPMQMLSPLGPPPPTYTEIQRPKLSALYHSSKSLCPTALT